MTDTTVHDYEAGDVRPGPWGNAALGAPGPLQPSQIPPTSDGTMNAWQTSVESRLGTVNQKVDDHLKWILVAFATGFVLLGGLVINRTDGLSDKISKLSQDIAVAQVRTEVLSQKATTVSPSDPPTKGVAPSS